MKNITEIRKQLADVHHARVWAVNCVNQRNLESLLGCVTYMIDALESIKAQCEQQIKEEEENDRY